MPSGPESRLRELLAQLPTATKAVEDRALAAALAALPPAGARRRRPLRTAFLVAAGVVLLLAVSGARDRCVRRRQALVHEPQRPPDRGPAGRVGGALATRAVRRGRHRRLARRDGPERHARLVAPRGWTGRRHRAGAERPPDRLR